MSEEERKQWSIDSFSGGMVDRVDDNLLKDDESPDCQNVYSDKIGALVKRRGQQKLNSLSLEGPVRGLYAYYDIPLGGVDRRLVAVANGTAYYWNPSTSTFVSLKTGLDLYAPYGFATCINYMVAANGVDAPWKWDGVAVSSLANAPADAKLPLLHCEMLFVTRTSEPYTVYFTEPFYPETWPVDCFFKVGEGDGDVITAMCSYQGLLTIFKRRSIWHLHGGTKDEFVKYGLRKMHDGVGCVGPNAVAFHGGRLYFVGDYGVYVWDGDQALNLTEDFIPNLWSNLNREYLHLAAVTVWRERLWVAVPEGSAQYNNLVLMGALDSETGRVKAWWPWRGINASVFCAYDPGTGPKLYAGGSDDGYVREQDVGTSDDGTAIVAYWTGKAFDIGAAESKKKFLRAFVRDMPSANDVDLSYRLDYGTWVAATAETTDPLVRRYKFPPGTYGRYFQPKLSHSTTASCAVRGLMVEHKAKKPR